MGYDSAIASHFGDLFDADGTLTTTDLGFIGSDIGKRLVVPSGSNWDDELSPSILAGLEDNVSSALTGVGTSISSGINDVPTPSVIIGSIPSDDGIIPAPAITDVGLIPTTDGAMIPVTTSTDVGNTTATAFDPSFTTVSAADPSSTFVPISDPALAPGTDSVTPIGDITAAPASASAGVAPSGSVSAAVSAVVTASV